MVSVKRCSLSSEYIDASWNLISALDYEEFPVSYVFWGLKYGYNDHWTDGEWKLIIASERYNKGAKESYMFIQDVLRTGIFTPIVLSDIEITGVNWDTDKHWIDRIDIKEYSQ